MNLTKKEKKEIKQLKKQGFEYTGTQWNDTEGYFSISFHNVREKLIKQVSYAFLPEGIVKESYEY